MFVIVIVIVIYKLKKIRTSTYSLSRNYSTLKSWALVVNFKCKICLYTLINAKYVYMLYFGMFLRSSKKILKFFLNLIFNNKLIMQ